MAPVVYQDYSEYESVDEEEPEEEKPSKAKKTSTKAREAAASTDRKSIKASDPVRSKPAPEKLKRSGSSGGLKAGQGSLKSFFGKK